MRSGEIVNAINVLEVNCKCEAKVVVVCIKAWILSVRAEIHVREIGRENVLIVVLNAYGRINM